VCHAVNIPLLFSNGINDKIYFKWLKTDVYTMPTLIRHSKPKAYLLLDHGEVSKPEDLLKNCRRNEEVFTTPAMAALQ